MAERAWLTVNTFTLVVVGILATILVGAVAVAMWASAAEAWAKVGGTLLAVVVVTGFLVRLWLISHEYGAPPPREH